MKTWAGLTEHPDAIGMAADALGAPPLDTVGRGVPVVRGWMGERAAPEAIERVPWHLEQGGEEYVSPRNRILGYVRGATSSRPRVQHPGRFDRRFLAGDDRPAAERFAELFTASGGEVERFTDIASATRWLAEFTRAFDCVTVGATVPGSLRPRLPSTCPDLAPLGVSHAAAGVAETGSLVLDSRDGRRTQLLAPTHVVFVREHDIHRTLVGAMITLNADLRSAVGLHSGASSSADVGQVLVRGVHGPGRIVAAIIGEAGRG